MEFQRMTAAHLDAVWTITLQAKRQLAGLGLDQWQKGYPSQAVWQADAANGTGWVAVEDGAVIAAFAYFDTPEPAYAKIDGAWRTDGPYAAIHRVCVADGQKGRGVAGAVFRFAAAETAARGLGGLRVDTHPGNLPMQRALEKSGFVRCGGIRLIGGSEDGDLRIAFELPIE